jgi:hypothetical protein
MDGEGRIIGVTTGMAATDLQQDVRAGVHSSETASSKSGAVGNKMARRSESHYVGR